MRRASSILFAAATALLTLLLLSRDTRALPVFARKYKTSCQTCHVAYPKLTPFGEAFRRNNFHFPDGLDEDYVKQKDVSLGAEGYKKVFPRSVWPGAIPGHVGLAAVAIGRASAATKGEDKISFAGLGGELQLTAAGTLGDSVSLWAGTILQASYAPEGETVHVILHRVFLNYSPFDEPWLLLRAGRFEPSLFSFSSHRGLLASYRFLSTAVLDNQFNLEPAQLGFELTGTLWHRLGYAVGLVEGAGNQLNAPKDVYGALRYKLGGLPLDGSLRGEKGDLLANPAPWRERSVTIGAFAYHGLARIDDPNSEAFTDDRFTIFGGDVNAILGDFNLIGVFTFQRNESPKLALPYQPVHTLNGMFEVDWVALPWLIPIARYEVRRLGGPLVDGKLRHAASGAVHALIRANVGAALRFEWNDDPRDGADSGVGNTSVGLFLTGAL